MPRDEVGHVARAHRAQVARYDPVLRVALHRLGESLVHRRRVAPLRRDAREVIEREPRQRIPELHRAPRVALRAGRTTKEGPRKDTGGQKLVSSRALVNLSRDFLEKFLVLGSQIWSAPLEADRVTVSN